MVQLFLTYFVVSPGGQAVKAFCVMLAMQGDQYMLQCKKQQFLGVSLPWI